MTSEDTCDGQPKDYSYCRENRVGYNHRVEPGGQPTPIPHSKKNVKPSSFPLSEKKVKQRKAQKKKQLFKSRMKGHVAYLEKKGWFKDENKEEDIIDNPSFSVMHSLSQGFTIKLWSCTHDTYGQKGQLRLPNAVHLVVHHDMILIWH